jgi:hypothetical protein
MWDESQRWPDGAVKEGKLIGTGAQSETHRSDGRLGLGQLAPFGGVLVEFARP